MCLLTIFNVHCCGIKYISWLCDWHSLLIGGFCDKIRSRKWKGKNESSWSAVETPNLGTQTPALGPHCSTAVMNLLNFFLWSVTGKWGQCSLSQGCCENEIPQCLWDWTPQGSPWRRGSFPNRYLLDDFQGGTGGWGGLLGKLLFVSDTFKVLRQPVGKHSPPVPQLKEENLRLFLFLQCI